MDSRLKQPIVLIVEDRMPELIKDLLSFRNGANYYIARDGVTAIQEVERLKPNLIILDLYLPRLNGWEVLKYVKDHYPDIAVVVLTGFYNKNIRDRAINLGADKVVRKPPVFQDLYRLIMRLIYRSKPGSVHSEVREDVKSLLRLKARRLRVLREKEALEGTKVDASVILEIEDLEQDICDLQEELRHMEKENGSNDIPNG